MEPIKPTQKPPAQIDVKKPGIGSWNQNLLWLIGGFVSLAIMAGVAFYIKKGKEPKQHGRPIVKQESFPNDFFAVPEKKPEPVVEKLPEYDLRMPPGTPPQPQLVQKKLGANDFFTMLPEIVRVDPASEINAARRGSANALIALSEADRIASSEPSKPQFVNAQLKWDEEQEFASYPVELERVITVDRNISAVLINAIDSELGGKVIAQIEENVYGAHGRKVLIPAGSRAVGRYQPFKKVGEERLLILWSRIITPEGINIHTGDAEMTDAMGRAGITGEVDKRYFERYGMALLVSTLSAATSYSIPVKDQNQAIVIQNYGREISTLSKTILDEHITIKPRVKVPAGSRIMISPSRDIWFKKPERKEIEVVSLEQNDKKR